MSDEDGEAGWPLWARAVGSVVLLVGVLMVAQAAFISDAPEVTGDLTLNATDGPEVTFTPPFADRRVNLTQPFPDSNTVVFESTADNMTVSAPEQIKVTANWFLNDFFGYHRLTFPNGPQSTNVTFKTPNKPAVIVSQVDGIEYYGAVVDDGNPDIAVDGAVSVDGNVTFTGLTSFTGQQISLIQENGQLNDQAVVDATGNVTFTDVDRGGGEMTLQTGGFNAPTLTNPEPVGVVQGLSEAPSNRFNVTVDSPKFPNTATVVRFYLAGNQVHSESIQSKTRVSAPVLPSESPGPGEHTMRVVATDTDGFSTSLSWNITVPSNLTVRDAQSPDRVLDNRTVNATFFSDGEIVEKSTDNGVFNLSGISPDSVTVSITAEDNPSEPVTSYQPTEDTILNFGKQQDAYLLPTTANNRTVRFTLDDRTGGKFTDNGERLLLQQPINQSGWANPRWETVFSEEFGPAGATAELIDGQRYRIVVRNNGGYTRVLGAYSADADETVPLILGKLKAIPKVNERPVAWNISYNETRSPAIIRFEYNDSQEKTGQIFLKIHEYQNESNVLRPNSSFGGTFGELTFTETLTQSETNTTWVVDVTAVRNGAENIKIKQAVGSQRALLPGLPRWLKTLISIGTILVVGGLFSQLNGAYGGLVMAALGGIFWFIGFMPPGAGIGVVILAMVVASAIFIRERQVAGI